MTPKTCAKLPESREPTLDAMDDIAIIALRLQLPAVYGYREFAEAGGLMSYSYCVTSHLRRRDIVVLGALQQGQRGRDRAIALTSRARMVAIEFGIWRSGRKGGASRFVTAGYGKLREQRGGTNC